MPFGKSQALAFARLITRYAHGEDMAVAQKNTAGVTRSRRSGRLRLRRGGGVRPLPRVRRYDHIYGNHGDRDRVPPQDFDKGCDTVGDKISVVLRDRLVTTPGSPRYVYDAC